MRISRLLFTLILLIHSALGLCNSDGKIESDEVERNWDFGIGLGYGSSSNPFKGSDDIPNFLSIDFSIYGEKFFFDNGEFGFTLIDKPNFGVNIISTFNSERIYYSYLNELGLNVNNSNNSLSLSAANPLAIIDSSTIITQVPDGDIIPSPAPPSVTLFPPGDFIISFDIPMP